MSPEIWIILKLTGKGTMYVKDRYGWETVQRACACEDDDLETL